MRNAFAALLVAAVTLVACNDVPSKTLAGYDLIVSQVVSSESRIKIDFLWVMDNSSSMCQEQNALARDFNVFVDQLKEFSNIDYRVAVTTTDVRTDGFKGSFRNVAASKFGPACQVNVIRECTDDAHCNYLREDYGSGWECSWTNKSLNLAVNDNGSVNSVCHKVCDMDDDCAPYFGATYECMTSAVDAEGCIEQPQVGGCPDQLPKVLDPSNFYNFYCNATVGAEGGKLVNLEAGLKAGWWALRRDDDICQSSSPNLCDLYAGLTIENKLAELPALLDQIERAIAQTQDDAYRQRLEEYRTFLTSCKGRLDACVGSTAFINRAEPNFLRDDAYLVVIFVSDEDDCSDRDDNPLDLNDTKLCAFRTEKLIPIKDLASSYKALKSDPAKVIVVGIVGDALTEGSDSCLISDECVHVRTADECSCYADTADKSECPVLLQGDDHRTMCTAACTEDYDPEARRTQWCLAEPPTDWCQDTAEGPDTSNCFLLEGMQAAFDKKIKQIEGWAAIDPTLLDDTQVMCVNKLPTFREQRTLVANALGACQPKLDEELAYRGQCLDSCLGKIEYNPNRKCSKLTPDACKCYDPALAGSAECQAALADEMGYRVACKRACFIDAKEVAALQTNTAPYVCSSVNGSADFGSRYVDFIDRFGRNGILANICAAGGLGASLKEIATSILPIIFRVCIPKTPEDVGTLRVVRTDADGNQTELTRGADADYEIVPDSQCAETKQAIIFHPVPAPSDKVEVFYNAKTSDGL